MLDSFLLNSHGYQQENITPAEVEQNVESEKKVTE